MARQFASARHQAALNIPTGYRRWTRCTFSRGGFSLDLEPTGGSFTQDTRRAGRWSGQLAFADERVLPRRPGDLLTPFGTRCEIELGLELLDGSVSTVPYGVYEISSSRPRVAADERFTDVSLVDVSGQTERYRFEEPLVVPAGSDLADMINAVVTSRIGRNPNVSDTGRVLAARRPFGLDPQTAPWSEILDVLSGFGLTAWYDRAGQIQVGSPNVDPDLAYPVDLLTYASPDFDSRPPNVVVARGEPQDGSTPVQAIAMDSDPSSPTYAGTGPGTSPYGRVTEFFSSPLLTTVGAAQAAANTILAQNVGAGATYTLIRPYDPTVDAGDVISHEGSAMAVDAVTVSLTGDTTLQVREL